MNSPVPSDDTSLPATPAPAPEPVAAGAVSLPRPVLYLLLALVGVALAVSGLLWQRLGGIQEQLARQSADSGAAAIEARTLARQAQEQGRDIAARQAVFDTKLTEVAMQRTQLEELMQSLTRSRDENMVVDIESAIRLAQQQAQLTGSIQPLLAALRSAVPAPAAHRGAVGSAGTGKDRVPHPDALGRRWRAAVAGGHDGAG